MLPISSEGLVNALRAAGEPTRLRILALLAEGERSVKDLTDILGQSQPRISRHLKLLADAGLIGRHREGAWAFFRLADEGPGGEIARDFVMRLDRGDQTLQRDRARLEAVRRAHAETATAYFSRHAGQWDRIRSLHVKDDEVEAAIVRHLGAEPIGTLVDIGTGTGRMLELLHGHAQRAVGVDLSHDMLSYARSRLERAGLSNCQVRFGDIYNLALDDAKADAVVIHQVLHYLDDPARAVAEAARLLKAGGRLAIADFAPHGLEFLRTEHAHARLGFARAQVIDWLEAAGVVLSDYVELPPDGAEDADKLTVALWLGRRTDAAVPGRNSAEEAA